MFEEVHPIVLKRMLLGQHADADCDFVFDNRWLQKENRPVFYYGVAHILKHRSRRQAYEILHPAGSDKGRNPGKSCALKRTVGWADEFFWLSVWARTGKLKGVPKPESIDNPHELFLGSLVVAEWGDLLRHAHCFYRHKLVPQRRDSDEAWDETDQFEVWRPQPSSEIGIDLFRRSEDRFRWADQALEHLERMLDKNGDNFGAEAMTLRPALQHTRWVIQTGWARILGATGQTGAAGDKLRTAIQYAPGDEQKAWTNTLWQTLFQASDGGSVDLDELTEREMKPDLEPVHILGSWIEDLLQDESHKTLHPRLSLPEEAQQDARIFPNLDTIQRLVDLLGEHRDWLRFVTRDGDKYLEMVREIEEADDRLQSAVFETECVLPGAVEGWQLFVLRDWGSYTPLLPSSLKARNPLRQSGGGGYFLRSNDLGIVIDPGYDFLEHFFDAGLRPAMITHVIVTHDHYDHTASFGPLLNLLFKDREQRNEPRRNVDFLLSRGVLDQYARFIVDFRYFGRVEPLTDCDADMDRSHLLSDERELQVFTTHAEHGESSGFGKGVGLVFKFPNELPCLGITSDTGWYRGGQTDGDDAEERSLGEVFESHKPEVMVLHVGSLKRQELHESGFYKKHLGARGVFLSIDAIESCRLALLSEFGEECEGHRRWFAEKITKHFGEPPRGTRQQFRCFPSDRKTCVVASTDGQLRIGRHDDLNKAVPYCEAILEKHSDGTFGFRR